MWGGTTLGAEIRRGKNQKNTEHDFLDLTLEQLLDTDFVVAQTRGGDGNLSGGLPSVPTPGGANLEGLKTLVAAESKNEYLIAGLVGDAKNDTSAKMARLTRELTALSAVGEADFTDLANKRQQILQRLYANYVTARHNRSRGKRTTAAGAKEATLGNIGSQSLIQMLMSLLEHAGTTNPALCRAALSQFREQLSPLEPFAFDDTGKTEAFVQGGVVLQSPLADVPILGLNSLREFLVRASSNADVTYRQEALELLVTAAITRGNLIYFLNVINLLLFPPNGQQVDSLQVLQTLRKFCDFESPIAFLLPSNSNQITSWAVSTMTASSGTMATDGSYLYVHNAAGLFKIGTGSGGSAPQVVYIHKPNFHPHQGDAEFSSRLVCIDDMLYFYTRSAKTTFFKILNCSFLNEVGKVDLKAPENSELAAFMEDFFNPPEVPADADAAPTTGTARLAAEAGQMELQQQQAMRLGGNYIDPLEKVPAELLMASDGDSILVLKPTVSQLRTGDMMPLSVAFLDPRKKMAVDRILPFLSIAYKRRTTTLLQLGPADGSMPAGGGKRKKGGNFGANAGFAMATLNKPIHGGTVFTYECWFRSGANNQNGQNATLFMLSTVPAFGGGCICGCINQNGYIQVGYVNGDGPSGQYQAQDLLIEQWNHYAFGYDGRAFWVAINGTPLTSSFGGFGGFGRLQNNVPIPTGSKYHNLSMALGDVGSNVGTQGHLAEVRLWSVHRTDVELGTSMRVQIPGSTPGLLGYWRMDDGAFMTAIDRSPGQQNAELIQCTWEAADPPFVVPEDTEELTVPVRFPSTSMQSSVITNGEMLEFIHRRTGVMNIRSDRIQVFDLETGLMLREDAIPQDEYTVTPACCYTKKTKSVWFKVASNFARYHLEPPRSMKNAAKKGSGEEFPTPAELEEKYGLPEFTAEDLNSAPRDFLESIALLPPRSVLIRVLSRIIAELDSNSVPESNNGRLRHSFIVELSPAMFEQLGDLIDKLSRRYLEPKADEPEDDLSLLALLTCVRLLKVNIGALVNWQVDPANCGFAPPVVTGNAQFSFKVKNNDASLLARLNPSDVRMRFVQQLQKLSTAPGTGRLGTALARFIQSEVCDALTAGLQIFYVSPKERVQVLGELLTEVMTAGKNADPRRVLLLCKYFEGQSAPRNVVTLLPAVTAALNASSTGATKTPTLLQNVLTVVLQDTESRLLSVCSAERVGNLLNEGNDQESDSISSAALPFLINMQSALFSMVDDQGVTKHILDHARHLSEACAELLTFTLERVIKSGTASDTEMVERKTYSARVLKKTIGALLLPLFSALWGLSLDHEESGNMLPSVTALLRAVDRITHDIPDVIVSEDTATASQGVSKLVPFTKVFESTHPVAQGITELVIDIPGAQSFTIQLDSRSLPNQQMGQAIGLYRDPGQNNPLPGMTNLTTSGPFEVTGGRAVVAYSAGYLEGAFGIRVNVTSNIIERHSASPWLLDLEKSIAVFAARCAAVITRGGPSATLPRSVEAWVDSELFAEGLELTAEELSLEQTGRLWVPAEIANLANRDVPATLPADASTLPAHKSFIDELIAGTGAAASFDERLRAATAGANRMLEPVPKDVEPIVSSAMRALSAVMLKQLLLLDEAVAFANSKATDPPESLKSVYARVAKLKRWLFNEFQRIRSSTESANAEASAAKAKEAKEKEKEKKKEKSKGKSKDKEKDKTKEKAEASPKVEEAAPVVEEKPVVSKEEIYTQLATRVIRAAEFLLRVVPLLGAARQQPGDRQPSVEDIGVLQRQKSHDNVGTTDITDEQRAALSTLKAWKASKEVTSILSAATSDERDHLLWNQVLKFISFQGEHSDIIGAFLARRQRAIIRCVGLSVFRNLVELVTLGSVRREIIGALIPALCGQNADITRGTAPRLANSAGGCGRRLRTQLGVVLGLFYKTLLGIMATPAVSGPDLIRTCLHSFNLDWSEDHDVIVHSGIFDALYALLSPDSTSADAKKSDTAYQTSAWALLDALTTGLVQARADRPRGWSDKSVIEPLFRILATQLSAMATRLEVAPTTAAAQDDVETLLKAAMAPITAETDASEALRTIKRATAGEAFGMDVVAAPPAGPQLFGTTTPAPAFAPPTSQSFADALDVKVLSLCYALAQWSLARPRLYEEATLKALFTVCRLGSARSRLVVSRVLRVLLSVSSAPGTSLVDACISQATSGDSKNGVEFFVDAIGQSLSTPAFVNLNSMTAAFTTIAGVPYETYRNNTFSWGENVMLVRLMTARLPSWRAAFVTMTEQVVAALPALVKRLIAATPNAGDNLSDDEWRKVWRSLGVVAVCGGYTDAARIGGRVFVEVGGYMGTVVSVDTNYVHVIRDDDDSISMLQRSEVLATDEVTIDSANLGVTTGNLVPLIELLREHSVPLSTLQDVESNPTLGEMLRNDLVSRGMRMLYNLLGSQDAVEKLLQVGGATALFGAAGLKIAVDKPTTTMATEDEVNNLIGNLASRVVRSKISVGVLQKENILSIGTAPNQKKYNLTKAPWKGPKIDAPIGGCLKYYLINETLTAEGCKDAIVLIDMLGEFEARALTASQLGAKAVILVAATADESGPSFAAPANMPSNDRRNRRRNNRQAARNARAAAELGGFGGGFAGEPGQNMFDNNGGFTFGGGGGFGGGGFGGGFGGGGFGGGGFGGGGFGMGRGGFGGGFGGGGFGGMPGGFAAAQPGFGAPMPAAGGAFGAANQENADEKEGDSSSSSEGEDGEGAKSSKGKSATPSVPTMVYTSNNVLAKIQSAVNVSQFYDARKSYRNILTRQLVEKGYKEEHAQRALKKVNDNVNEAIEWLEQNMSWLKEQEDMLSALEKPGDNKPAVEKTAEARKRTDRSIVEAWDAFNLVGGQTINPMLALQQQQGMWGGGGFGGGGAFGGMGGMTAAAPQVAQEETVAKVLSHASPTWHAEIGSRNTNENLRTLQEIQLSATVQYGRRALTNMIVHWPQNVQFESVITTEQLMKAIEAGLFLDDLDANPKETGGHVSATALRSKLVEILRDEFKAGRSTVATLLKKRCAQILQDLQELDIRPPMVGESPHYVMAAGVNTSRRGVINGGTSAQSIAVAFDSLSSTQNGWTLRFYADEARQVVVKTFDQNRNCESFVHVGSVLYYEYETTNYANGAYGFRFTATPNSKSGGQAASADGETDTLLTYLEVLMKSECKILTTDLLVNLLDSLAALPSASIAQRCCYIAAGLFRRYPQYFVDEDTKGKGKADVESTTDAQAVLIRQVALLEEAYDALRTRRLVHWDAVSAPTSHVQALLELLLAARLCFPNDKAGLSLTAKADDPVVQVYKTCRDGASSVGLIDIVGQRRLSSLEFGNGTNADIGLNGMGCPLVGDVCLTGSKWYFEVTLNNIQQYLAIGFCKRRYTAQTATSGLQGDQQYTSWGIQGPGTLQWISSRPNEVVQQPNWSVVNQWKGRKTVVGMYIDLDTREMGITQDGKNQGVGLRGFDPEEGVYPLLISYNPGSDDIEVNFGAKPFAFPIPDGFYPIENPEVRINSWLVRYQHAAEVARELHERKALSDATVSSALEVEKEPHANELRFEFVETDSVAASADRGPEMLLSDDGDCWMTYNSGVNVHMVFKVAGDVEDFVLREVVVRNPVQKAAPPMSQAFGGFGNRYGQPQVQPTPGVGFGVESGLIFVSKKRPDIESLTWCNNFTGDRYTQFVERKKELGQALRPTEPVAFFRCTQGKATTTVTLPEPQRGQYIVVKFLRGEGALQLACDRLIFKCIHGAHPMAPLIGLAGWQERAEEIYENLRRSANFDASWSVGMDEQIVQLAQTIANRSGVKSTDLDAVMLRPMSDDLIRFKALAMLDPNALRARFSIIKYLNRSVTPLLQYVDVSMYAKFGKKLRSDTTKERDVDEHSLSHIVYKIKGLFFLETKKSVFDIMLSNATKVAMDVPRISVNRLSAMAAKTDNVALSDPDGTNTVFGQIYTQMKTIAASTYRMLSKDQNIFRVDFVGEGSIDVGGPYREALVCACNDLMSTSTPLFIRSPNGSTDVGLNREKWIVNPGAKSAVHQSMYQFIGVLFGAALRTKVALPVQLPSIVWKGLLGEEISVDDLEAVDKLCIQAMDKMKELSREEFDTVVQEVFTTLDASGAEMELKPGGKDIRVTYDDRHEFAALVIKARLHEADAQITAIRKGLNSVVPVGLLSLFSWNDLELMVCGNPDIDIEALKNHTKYTNGFSVGDPTIKMFWRALQSFTQEERQLFLRFVWGRNRLPLADSDWTQHFTVTRLANDRTTDDTLPVAHTCFFILDLPEYPTYEILRSKLLFAIINCQAIDTDFNPSASTLTTWIDV